jgi:hypothetical protein
MQTVVEISEAILVGFLTPLDGRALQDEGSRRANASHCLPQTVPLEAVEARNAYGEIERTQRQQVHIPDEADQRSGVMSITIPG